MADKRHFAVKLDKENEFIGKKALLKINEKPLNKKIVMMTLDNSKPGEPLLLHDEPIYYKGKIIGETTSGNYSFNYDKNLSFGYINSKISNEQLVDKNFYIEIEKIKYPAKIITKPLKQHNFKNI